LIFYFILFDQHLQLIQFLVGQFAVAIPSHYTVILVEHIDEGLLQYRLTRAWT
jgi:hypothetical protein